MKPTKTWKSIEKKVANILSPIFGTQLYRNITSGSNNRRDTGEPRRGDITLPEGVRAVVEVKHRQSIGFHRFFEQAEEDCEKANFPLDNAILFSHEKQSKKFLVTINSNLFIKLLEIARDTGELPRLFGSQERS